LTTDTDLGRPKWLEATFTVRSIVGLCITGVGLIWLARLANAHYGFFTLESIGAYFAVIGLIDFGRWLRK
jgi:hypothetical protein